ncbi:MAG: hypothetical protein WBF66_07885, partial [Dehalococcoidia bacterium]
MKRRNLPLVGIILALSVALGLVAFRGTAETQPDPHYACYTAPGPILAEPPITLNTQFGLEEGVEVVVGELLCNPAGKHGEPFPPEAPHLRWFNISAPELMPTRYVNVSDQFGSWENVPVGDPIGLLSPALKTIGEPLPPEDPPEDPHYKCYQLPYLGPGEELVLVSDQFYPQGFDWWVSTTPNRLCLPAGKNGGLIPEASHLLCHAASGPMAMEEVNLKTQFGEETNVWVDMGMELCAPASKVEVAPPQYPSFSIDLNSISAVVFDAADILFNPGWPAVGIPCANLGLAGCGGFDDLDALSYGADFGDYSSQEGYIGFSVDTGAQGLANTAVNVEANCQPGEPEADEFITDLALDTYGYGTNTQRFDGDGIDCAAGGPSAAPAMGLQEPSGDDLDALDDHDPSFVDDGTGGEPAGDGIPDRWVYFSLQPGSTTLAGMAVPPTGRVGSPADILVTAGGMAPNIYADFAQLGLVAGDDVDGMCLAETAMDDIFDPDGGITGLQDYLFYTITPASPSAGAVADPGDIVYVSPTGPVIVDEAAALGLLDSDDLNAIKCVKGLVDIDIEDFVVELPDGTPVREGDDVTLDLTVSQWVTLNVWEDKHYTGVSEELSPQSVTSQVAWWVTSLPTWLNVVWQAAGPGDVCTLDQDVVNCDPDVPTPHDINDIHFDFDLNWCQQPDPLPAREVQLHCKEPGDATITFVNWEMPLGADDIDQDNNLSYVNLNIHCEEAPEEAHYKCYDIFPQLAPPVPFVELETQFGHELVEVGPNTELCAPAIKNGEGDLTDPHLKCYDIWGGDPDVVVNLETQFGVEENVEVGPARLLCMGASKEVVFPDPTYCCDACPGYPMCFDAPTLDVCLQYGCMPLADATCLNPEGMCEPLAAPQPPADLHYECFDISATGHDPPDVVSILQDQFGLKFDVDVGPAELLCAPALKEGIGTLDAPHLKCYQIPPHFPGEYWVHLNTQWGFEEVMVGEARWLCAEATKEVVIEDPTFSIARGGPSTPAPVDPADLVIRTLPGGVWPPTVVYACAAFTLSFCGGADDVNALSLGQDFTLPPPDPANPNADLFFSVDPASVGLAGSGVNNETLGCLPEPEADEFGTGGGATNYQYFDGDGIASCANPGAPSLGLTEPPPVGGPSDDLDALDPLNLALSGPPIFGSLDAASPSIGMYPHLPQSAADIFVDFGAGIAGLYAPAGMLGLDMMGMNSDDIDALCIDDANGDTTYSPGVDRVWFSLTRGSATLPLIGLAGAS